MIYNIIKKLNNLRFHPSVNCNNVHVVDRMSNVRLFFSLYLYFLSRRSLSSVYILIRFFFLSLSLLLTFQKLHILSLSLFLFYYFCLFTFFVIESPAHALLAGQPY